ncbi:MAG: ABC transporter ATP-binding protein [Burkholderiales bacterium]
MTPGLTLEHVGVRLGAAHVLEGVSLDVPVGQFVSLLGASGSGKSTLLRLVVGLAQATSGRLAWAGEAITATSIERGLVFQDYALYPWMTLTENVALAVARRDPRLPPSERRAQAHAHLSLVGLADAAEKHPFEVSGGMQQRAAIARALALGSSLLALDEPFGALDPVNRARLQDLLLEIWDGASPRKTILFVTHDVDEALYLGARVVILGGAPGRVISDFEVPFPRPRDRGALLGHRDFHRLRDEIATRIDRDMLDRLKAA